MKLNFPSYDLHVSPSQVRQHYLKKTWVKISTWSLLGALSFLMCYLFYQQVLEQHWMHMSTMADQESGDILLSLGISGSGPVDSQKHLSKWLRDAKAGQELTCSLGSTYTELGLHFHCVEEIYMSPNDTLGDAQDKLYRFLNRIHVECRDNQWLGNPREGGWDVCLSGPYMMNYPCHIISIGIHNDWSFDDAIVNKYGCLVDAYDPSIYMFFQGPKRGTQIRFWKKGVDGQTYNTDSFRKWSMYTLQDLIEPVTVYNEVLDYLKFDIEGSEWSVLERAIADGVLARFKQIAFEVHMVGSSRQDYFRFWKILTSLEAIGFRRWTFFVNPGPKCEKTPSQKQFCKFINVNYININYLPGIEKIRKTLPEDWNTYD